MKTVTERQTIADPMSDECVATGERSAAQVTGVFARRRLRDGGHSRTAAVPRRRLVSVDRAASDHLRRQQRTFISLDAESRLRWVVGVEVGSEQLRSSCRRVITIGLFVLPVMMMMMLTFSC